ncbi:MAG: ornithine carbamoyltransferase [Candidatus Pacebacteria bacterium]|nr:ornithine carbamoyltransferase [Candidatus Paceibacterota bacterium]
MIIQPDLRGRHLLTLNDLSDREFLQLINLAQRLKEKKKEQPRGSEQLLRGKNIALVFEKASTRTRCAATAAAFDEGGHVEYLGKEDIHLGKKESVPDTARVLGRMFDGILFRGFAHATVSALADYAGVPVWNGLTDDAHPTQILADLLTVKQTFESLEGLTVVYVGDGRNNVCNSLMLGCAKAGVNFVNCCPPQLAPAKKHVKQVMQIAEKNRGTITVSQNVDDAVRGANVVYTDVWVSMGEEAVMDERIRLLKPYQVNMSMMQRTGNLESDRVIFLHCLPAFHNHDTVYTSECGALEVTDDVFEAPFSKVFDQAENRLHTIKAMMVATLGES